MTESTPSRAALVTGGARGIGRATALRLAADGCAVTIADRNPEGEAVAAEIVAAGGRAQFVATDVADQASVIAAVDATVATYGSVDVLAAVAAVLGNPHETAELPLEEWRRVLAINLDGVLHCCQAVLPHMLERGWGRIVAVSSHGRKGSPTFVPYAVSKGGLQGLIGAIANAYASRGLLANLVVPGQVRTDMIVPRYDAEYLENPPGTPIGRLSEPEEVAEVIAFLCSERNTYVVNATWNVDGGVFE